MNDTSEEKNLDNPLEKNLDDWVHWCVGGKRDNNREEETSVEQQMLLFHTYGAKQGTKY